jgi:hypothetical protein
MRIKPLLTAHENYVATILVIVMIMLPPLALVWPVVAGTIRDPWIVDSLQVAIAVVGALVAGALLRRSPKIGRGVTLRAYARAFLYIAIWSCFRGLWLLVTGHSATRYHSYRLPRANSVWDFGLSIAFALLAVGCGLVGERTRSQG